MPLASTAARQLSVDADGALLPTLRRKVGSGSFYWYISTRVNFYHDLPCPLLQSTMIYRGTYPQSNFYRCLPCLVDQVEMHHDVSTILQVNCTTCLTGRNQHLQGESYHDLAAMVDSTSATRVHLYRIECITACRVESTTLIW